MKIIASLAVAILLTIGQASSFMNHPEKGSHLYISDFENVLGTFLELKINAASKNDASVAETAALKEIARLNRILSAYDPASEFSAWLGTDVFEKIKD